MKHKELIKKIILLTISVIIILFIIINNFIGGSGRPKTNKTPSGAITGEGISYEEAARYFSFFLFSREEMQALQGSSKSMYVNALVEGGVIEKVEDDLSQNLTCGTFRDMLWALVDLLDLNYKELSASLPVRLQSVTEEDELLYTEFIEVYQSMINQVNEKRGSMFLVEKLYLLSTTESNQVGTYIAQNQTTYYSDTNYITFQQDDYVEVLTYQGEILMLLSKLNEPVTIHNAYLKKGQDQEIQAYICSVDREYKTSLPLSESFSNVVGDITLENGVVTQISLKSEIIRGKVLLTGKDEIEIEGYGVLPLHEDYRIYKVYGELKMEQTNSILVGYAVTDFVVSEGKVCAALIQEKINADNIRVLINTTGYQSVYHDVVTFTSEEDFIIDDGEHQVTIKAGDSVTVAKGSKMLESGRIKVTSTNEEGKIQLTSISRSYGMPKYRGSIEIAVSDKGLTVVNELSIEEYLYSVVPSEMPISYGDEALKVQAVCARSYAYKQLMANKYSTYGAHVDDSVNCQVYNNVEESEASILSVKETYGQVLTSDGNVITAFYFSTSCGYTAAVEDVWQDSASASYLSGRFQAETEISVDLSKESNFRNFIIADSVEVLEGNTVTQKSFETFESGFLMYRWNVTFDLAMLSNQINEKLKTQYTYNSNSILTYIGKITDTNLETMELKNKRVVNDMVFATKPVDTIGTIRDLQVVERGESGIIKALMIIGTEKTILLRYQTNVRTFLAPTNLDIIRLDGSTISGMSLLPSAFCILDPIRVDGKLTGFLVTGGGFGHGVGMSQNGVKALTKLNWSYEDILKHYYSDTEITVIYE